jgi:hypothetical protein
MHHLGTCVDVGNLRLLFHPEWNETPTGHNKPALTVERAMKLEGGKNDYSWHFGPRAWKRIQKELAEKKK